MSITVTDKVKEHWDGLAQDLRTNKLGVCAVNHQYWSSFATLGELAAIKLGSVDRYKREIKVTIHHDDGSETKKLVDQGRHTITYCGYDIVFTYLSIDLVQRDHEIELGLLILNPSNHRLGVLEAEQLSLDDALHRSYPAMHLECVPVPRLLQ
ncbi:MAG: hypothetical protein Q7R96_05240 [Nanoarchaeota archaeon]|nr:hypothetical protein [Nanoarchaeota archaeon]